MRHVALALGIAISAAVSLAPSSAFAQSGPSGGDGCSVLTQQASNGAQARIAADDAAIKPPQSVTQLSCLDSFFNGVGLDVITNWLNPTNLLKSVEGQICNAVQSTWTSLLGSSQCGITLTGFNIGFFGGLGGGNFCPKLSFGGGGPPLGSVSLSGSGNGGYFVNGAAVPPQGYTAPTTGGLW